MIFRLDDICTLTKGTTGITKAVPGSYPLVTLSEERKTHNNYQFNAKAVIVPLISSTGHGHASMKRIHYQEGKFALGTILCALIPRNEKIINAKYLHIYLTQYKDSLLVPLMKGAANVSLPMNKIADLEIEIPSLDKQKKIIGLEKKLSILIDKLSSLLNNQELNLKKLKQRILNNAIQGKLVLKDPNDEPAFLLLEKIQQEKEKLIKAKRLKKGRPIPPTKEEDIPFVIPDNWVWCRLGDIITVTSGDGLTSDQMDKNGNLPVYGGNGVNGYHIKSNIEERTIIIGRVGANCGNVHLTENKAWITDNAFIVSYSKNNIDRDWLIWTLRALNLGSMSFQGAQPVISGKRIYPKIFPLPPKNEQKRIGRKIEELLKVCDELEKKVKKNQDLIQQLLQS
ncbi:MAG: restriction endonuclease subunit S, partial [Ignavibacteriaceae bacterium]